MMRAFGRRCRNLRKLPTKLGSENRDSDSLAKARRKLTRANLELAFERELVFFYVVQVVSLTN